MLARQAERAAKQAAAKPAASRGKTGTTKRGGGK
jgi:hypothetical protein